MNSMTRFAQKLSLLLIMAASVAAPSLSAQAVGAPEIKIDVPVVLQQVKVVFNMDHAAFNGDTPVGLKHMTMMHERYKQSVPDLSIVGAFHGDAGYMLLNDESYNAVRKTKTGNPYKGMVENLIKEGVKIEACAVTMKGNAWGNENLLPGVKVNSSAVSRVIQLVQDGYVMIQP